MSKLKRETWVPKLKHYLDPEVAIEIMAVISLLLVLGALGVFFWMLV